MQGRIDHTGCAQDVAEARIFLGCTREYVYAVLSGISFRGKMGYARGAQVIC